MVQFVENGPDIPERLLDLHEEGKVVFFCGAGISMSAGLPGFRGLVEDLCKQPRIQTLRDSVLDQAKKLINAKVYDEAIEVLEKDYIYDRNDPNGIGSMIKKILSPKKESAPEINTHEALLKLSRDGEGNIKLVTTNFDCLFEKVIESKKYATSPIIAPVQTIPPNYQDGLIYLHGLISSDSPSNIQNKYLDKLIISARDYGQAYLSKGWAARFINELFQNYTVCFIGYSGNDVMVRYMIKARALDKKSSEIFAFAGYEKGEKEQKEAEWKEESITPILYPDDEQHFYLHKTLYEWAQIYQDGVYDKKKIIDQHATETPPSVNQESLQENFFINRALWAIIDEEASRSFANINPAPSLEWLKHFSEKRFEDEDWVKFGIIQNGRRVRKDVTSDPSSSTNLSRIYVTGTEKKDTRLAAVISQLSHWLRRHLNNPELVLWLSQWSGQLNEEFADSIYRKILHFDELKKKVQVNEDAEHELQRIERDSPDAAPNSVMQIIWRIILSGRFGPYHSINGHKVYNWCDDFNQNGLTLGLRMELRKILAPYVSVTNINRPLPLAEDEGEARHVKDIFDCQIILALGADYYKTFYDLVVSKGEVWRQAPPDLAQECSLLLKDYLDLDKELGNLTGLKYSSLKIPSIVEYEPHHHEEGWVILAKLTYDAWLNTRQIDQRLAKRVAENWQQMPYPLFKRLSLSAATNSDVIEPYQAVNWLLSENGCWLWALATENEVMRLLVHLSPNLNEQLTEILERSILKGPSNSTEFTDRKVQLRLEKMQAHGATLSDAALSKLNALPDQRGSAHASTGNEDDESLISSIETGYQIIDNHIEDPLTEISELCDLAQKDKWPVDDWNRVLRYISQNTSNNGLLIESWCRMAPVFCKLPDNVLEKLLIYFSLWIEKLSEQLKNDDDEFFTLIHRILDCEHSAYEKDLNTSSFKNDLAACAISHPVGHAVQALINWWYRKRSNSSTNAKELHSEIRLIFTKLCRENKEHFRHGRLLLSTHVTSLIQTDENWTKKYLLPFFNWKNSEDEACATWQGFLCQNKFYCRLLSIIQHIKWDFLETSKHYDQLDRYAGQFVSSLTQISLDREDIFTIDELRNTTKNLPIEGLAVAAYTLIGSLEKSDNQRREYWNNHTLPYLEKIWPQSRAFRTLEISRWMRILCVEAGAAFPDAVKELKIWLQRDNDSILDSTLHSLDETEHCKNFPRASLEFLNVVVDDNLQTWLWDDLRKLLNNIEDSDETLVKDKRFMRLGTICRWEKRQT